MMIGYWLQSVCFGDDRQREATYKHLGNDEHALAHLIAANCEERKARTGEREE